jgi:hypothetical protein
MHPTKLVCREGARRLHTFGLWVVARTYVGLAMFHTILKNRGRLGCFRNLVYKSTCLGTQLRVPTEECTCPEQNRTPSASDENFVLLDSALKLQKACNPLPCRVVTARFDKAFQSMGGYVCTLLCARGPREFAGVAQSPLQRPY